MSDSSDNDIINTNIVPVEKKRGRKKKEVIAIPEKEEIEEKKKICDVKKKRGRKKNGK